MKTKANTLKLMILSIIILAATSCKKEEPQAPTPPPAQLYTIEYRATISGTGVAGTVDYYDPDTQSIVTENIYGTSKSIGRTFTKGASLYFAVHATGNTGVNLTATADIYINNVKRYSQSTNGTIAITANTNGEVN